MNPRKRSKRPLAPISSPRPQPAKPWFTLAALAAGALLLLVIVFAAGVYVAGGFVRGMDSTHADGTETEVLQADPIEAGVEEEEDDQSSSSDANTDQDQVDQPASQSSRDLNFGQFYWTRALGGIKVFGELWNEGDEDLHAIEILVLLRDEAGDALESATVPVHLGVIRAGRMTPFQVVLPDASDEFDQLHLEAVGDPLQINADVEHRRYELLEVIGGEWHVEENARRITGEILNSGDRPCELIHVIAAGYSADGTLQFVEWTFADVEVLEPGAAAPFEIPIFDPDFDEPSELRVFVQSWEVNR